VTNKTTIGVAAILAVGTTSFCAGRLMGNARAQAQTERTARCTVVVPNEWEYIGAGSYGLETKDDKGTVRFIRQFSYGLDEPPNISLELHRK
jgi:hypothetical protein